MLNSGVLCANIVGRNTVQGETKNAIITLKSNKTWYGGSKSVSCEIAYIVKLIKAGARGDFRPREQVVSHIRESTECEEKEVINVTVNHTHVFNEFQNI